MLHHTIMSWSLAASLVLGFAAPVLADKGGFGNAIGAQPSKITVKEIGANTDDTRIFQQWYGNQMHGYDGTDTDTGERYVDLIQMVTEVTDQRLMVTDQQGLLRGVFLTRRTQIVDGMIDNRLDTYGGRKPTAPPARAQVQTTLRPGDLVIVNGFLRSGGGVSATSIRVMGHAQGYGYRDQIDDRSPAYGYRVWGTIRRVDARRGSLELDANPGRRTITLGRNAEILVDGKQRTLDYIRQGDRVVVYYRDNADTRSVTAYRIVLLRETNRDPEMDRSYWADPDTGDGAVQGTLLEGRVQSITSGIFFNLITLQATGGRETVIRAAKSIEAIDRDGDRISVFNLRQEQRVRVYYTNLDGNFFADRIEIQ